MMSQMRATLHLASSLQRNYEIRLLNRENLEVGYCQQFGFTLIKDTGILSRCLTLQTERLSIFSLVFFCETIKRDANFLS